jgi:hypothetical protein
MGNERIDAGRAATIWETHIFLKMCAISKKERATITSNAQHNIGTMPITDLTPEGLWRHIDHSISVLILRPVSAAVPNGPILFAPKLLLLCKIVL